MAQNAAALADETVKMEAQASVSGLSHARMAGTIAPRKRSVERMMASIQVKVTSVVKNECVRKVKNERLTEEKALLVRKDESIFVHMMG